MAGVNPRFLCGDYAMIRAYRALYFWGRERMRAPQTSPAEKPGLDAVLEHVCELLHRLDRDKSKRREMDEDIKSRGRT